LAIASLVISVGDRNSFSSPNCGFPGYPRFYLTISISFTITSILQNNFRWITGLSSTFIFAWMIVGAVSLWRVVDQLPGLGQRTSFAPSFSWFLVST
jgi:TM2 domain-containing membrane protein YozV